MTPPKTYSIFLTLALTFAVISCGSGSGNRQLQSITITPSSATASGNATVQFVATGTYSDGSKVKNLPVLWSIGNPWSLTPIACCVNLSTTGIAQCQGGVGSFSIDATAPADPSMPLSMMNMSSNTVGGTAQLMCD